MDRHALRQCDQELYFDKRSFTNHMVTEHGMHGFSFNGDLSLWRLARSLTFDSTSVVRLEAEVATEWHTQIQDR